MENNYIFGQTLNSLYLALKLIQNYNALPNRVRSTKILTSATPLGGQHKLFNDAGGQSNC